MPKFFVTNHDIKTGETMHIVGDDASHIKRSLRMKQGDHIVVCDGFGNDYSGIIAKLEENSVAVEIIQKNATCGESDIKINLFMAITKGDSFEYAIQKCIEAGVHSITPIITQRTVVDLKGTRADKKHVRWNKIALEAAKQSKRSIIPSINYLSKFDETLKHIHKKDLNVICYVKEGTLSLKTLLKQNKNAKTINVFIGPEGGFTEQEWVKAIKNGLFSVSLGNRVLKAETVGLFVTAVVMYEFDQLDKKVEKSSKAK